MTRRRDFHIRLRFWNCRVSSGLEGVRQIVNAFPDLGLIPAQHIEGRDVPLPPHSVDARLTQAIRKWPNWSREEHLGRYEYASGPLVLIVKSFEALITSAEFFLVTPDYLRLSIGGLVDFEFKDQSALVAPFAERLREVALDLWTILSPDYGYVDETSAMHTKSDKHVMRLAFPQVLGWVDIFGRAYIEKYGRELLMGLPGYRVKEIEGQGIMHQLTPSILKQDPSEGPALRKEVEMYLREHGIKARCKGPYQL